MLSDIQSAISAICAKGARQPALMVTQWNFTILGGARLLQFSQCLEQITGLGQTSSLIIRS